MRQTWRTAGFGTAGGTVPWRNFAHFNSRKRSMRLSPALCGLMGGIALLAGQPAAPAPFTLADALAAAYQTNPQLASARASLDALDQGVAQADAGWRPS